MNVMIEWQLWWRVPQQLRFLMAGGFNTLFGYLVFSGLFLLVGKWIYYLLIGLAAHLIASINAFVVYRHLVFRSTDSWWPSFIRFNLSQISVLVFGMAGLFALVEFFHFNPLAGQALMTGIAVLLAYVLHRFFSFGNRSDDNL